MGLGIGQLGALTGIRRKHDIGRQLQHLSNDKSALMREMQNVTKNYHNALNKKKLKWSGNSGVSYTDISYNVLMRPNEYNTKSPIMVTDKSGKIVVDNKYKKYAEMISSDGSSGGKYEGDTKYKILESLTGISEEKLKKYVETSQNVQNAADLVNESIITRDKIDIKSQTLDLAHFISKFLNPSTLGCKGHEVDGSNVDTYINKVKNALLNKDYFTADQEGSIKEACDQISQNVKTNKSEKISIDDFMASIAGAIIYKLGGGDTIHIMADRNGNGLQSSYDSANQTYKNALTNYNNALNENGQVFTSEEKILVEYYDLLFTSIVDNGWVNNDAVNDSDYLNQMLQNNEYNITTITKNPCFDPDKPECIRNIDFEYSTDIASNFENIYPVSDDDIREEAFAEYEYQKQIISNKEARIDTRMKNLETEQQSITKMLESLDKVKEDNIERAYGLWA